MQTIQTGLRMKIAESVWDGKNEVRRAGRVGRKIRTRKTGQNML